MSILAGGQPTAAASVPNIGTKLTVRSGAYTVTGPAGANLIPAISYGWSIFTNVWIPQIICTWLGTAGNPISSTTALMAVVTTPWSNGIDITQETLVGMYIDSLAYNTASRVLTLNVNIVSAPR